MQNLHLPATFVSIEWQLKAERWAADLLFETETGYERVPLEVGQQIEWEVTDDRHCTGYRTKVGTRRQCPDDATIPSGDQCQACRARDANTTFVEGRGGSEREGDHSVYLAQCGSSVKVGVTRSSRLFHRWLEQGAAYAVEIGRGLTASEALRWEQELAREGLLEGVRAENTVPLPENPVLEKVINEHGLTTVGEIVDVQALSKYERISCGAPLRSGRISGTVTSVCGQIIEIDSICLAVTGGRRVIAPRQTMLTEY